VSVAVILAAGMGTRLRDEHADLPKGFVELAGRPIIETSIAHLERAGISDIVIVTGYAAEHYRQLAIRYEGLVRLAHNRDFAESGSMYSLYCARHVIDDDFLLLESDLIYEPRALDVLIGHESSDAVLLSGPTGAGDEVYVAAPDGRLVAMSKDRNALPCEPAGELVGISKISRGLFAIMKGIAERAFRDSLHYDYETDCLVAAAQSWAIACPVVADLAWAEIDDPAHLRRARDEVLPRIMAAL
jgi:2-aminoethylphosphonate-pyruvate transaminase